MCSITNALEERLFIIPVWKINCDETSENTQMIHKSLERDQGGRVMQPGRVWMCGTGKLSFTSLSWWSKQTHPIISYVCIETIETQLLNASCLLQISIYISARIERHWAHQSKVGHRGTTTLTEGDWECLKGQSVRNDISVLFISIQWRLTEVSMLTSHWCVTMIRYLIGQRPKWKAKVAFAGVADLNPLLAGNLIM